MEVTSKVIKVKSRSDWVNVILLGDLHIGNIGCQEGRIKKYVDWIKEKPNTYWVDMGDNIEGISHLDPRYDPDSISHIRGKRKKDIVRKQVKRYEELFSPIADKCLAMIYGNHEQKLLKHADRDVHEEMVEIMQGHNPDIPDLQCEGLIRLRFKRSGGGTKTFKMAIRHKLGSATTAPGVLRNLIKGAAMWHDIDCFVLAHSHMGIMYKKPLKDIVGDKPPYQYRDKVIQLIASPGFLKGYVMGAVTYVEEAGYSPTITGVAKLQIKPFANTHQNGKNMEKMKFYASE